MSPIHFLDRAAELPLCRRPTGLTWSWTLAPIAVSCLECARLLRLLREAAAAREADGDAPQP